MQDILGEGKGDYGEGVKKNVCTSEMCAHIGDLASDAKVEKKKKILPFFQCTFFGGQFQVFCMVAVLEILLKLGNPG